MNLLTYRFPPQKSHDFCDFCPTSLLAAFLQLSLFLGRLTNNTTTLTPCSGFDALGHSAMKSKFGREFAALRFHNKFIQMV
jgi:hypothetical protein